MKEFWIYTVMRFVVFVGAFLIVLGIWDFVSDTPPNVVVVVILAFLLSGVASYVLLQRQRNALAQRVESRAGRISARMEEMRTREDEDEEH